MPMDWGALRNKVDTRLAAAVAAAALVAPGIVFIKSGRNLKKVELDAETEYIRGYLRRSTTKRLAAGDWTVERSWCFVAGQILTKSETDQTRAEAVFAAIAPFFLTAADGLEFEEAPHFYDGSLDGSHWVNAFEFPFFADVQTSL